MKNYAPTLTQREVDLLDTIERSRAISPRRQISGNEHSVTGFHNLDEYLWRINWAKLGYPFVGVYCICPDNRWPTKVGVSQNVPKRLDNIQVGVWRQVDVFEYSYCRNSADAVAVEAKTHSLMRDAGLLMQGEWFDIRPEKAAEYISFAADLLNIELLKSIPDQSVKDAIYQAILRFSSNPRLSTAAKDLKNTTKVKSEYPVLKVAIERRKTRAKFRAPT